MWNRLGNRSPRNSSASLTLAKGGIGYLKLFSTGGLHALTRADDVEKDLISFLEQGPRPNSGATGLSLRQHPVIPGEPVTHTVCHHITINF